jgi:hypothetical protein
MRIHLNKLNFAKINFVVQSVLYNVESKSDDIPNSNMFNLEPKGWI